MCRQYPSRKRAGNVKRSNLIESSGNSRFLIQTRQLLSCSNLHRGKTGWVKELKLTALPINSVMCIYRRYFENHATPASTQNCSFLHPGWPLAESRDVFGTRRSPCTKASTASLFYARQIVKSSFFEFNRSTPTISKVGSLDQLISWSVSVVSLSRTLVPLSRRRSCAGPVYIAPGTQAACQSVASSVAGPEQVERVSWSGEWCNRMHKLQLHKPRKRMPVAKKTYSLVFIYKLYIHVLATVYWCFKLQTHRSPPERLWNLQNDPRPKLPSHLGKTSLSPRHKKMAEITRITAKTTWGVN